eukprot:8031896-Ditylum_brightwellii.AAC.1
MSQLYAALEEDYMAVSNLTDTNQQLTEQVTNFTAKLTTKDEEIKALKKSIDNFTETMYAFTTAQYRTKQWTTPVDNSRWW